MSCAGTSTQTGGPPVNRWEKHTGAFRTLPTTATATTAAAVTVTATVAGGTGVEGNGDAAATGRRSALVTDRKALTAALVHFSRALGSVYVRRLQ